MGTWHLPGGHRITGVPDIPEDYTPTAEEMFWAMVMPPNLPRILADRSGEGLFYFGMKMTVGAISLYMASGQSITAYLTVRSVASIPVTAPLVVAGLGLMILQQAYARDMARRDIRYKILHLSGEDLGSSADPLYQPTYPGITY